MSWGRSSAWLERSIQTIGATPRRPYPIAMTSVCRTVSTRRTKRMESCRVRGGCGSLSSEEMSSDEMKWVIDVGWRMIVRSA